MHRILTGWRESDENRVILMNYNSDLMILRLHDDATFQWYSPLLLTEGGTESLSCKSQVKS